MFCHLILLFYLSGSLNFATQHNRCLLGYRSRDQASAFNLGNTTGITAPHTSINSGRSHSVLARCQKSSMASDTGAFSIFCCMEGRAVFYRKVQLLQFPDNSCCSAEFRPVDFGISVEFPTQRDQLMLQHRQVNMLEHRFLVSGKPMILFYQHFQVFQ